MSDDRMKWYNEGYCDSEIASKMGKNKASIALWRKKKGLPSAFENRKRLTEWEIAKIQDYIMSQKKYRNLHTPTLRKLEKGLTAFVMSLRIPLAKVSQSNIEDYVILHNQVDLSRRNELLRTNFVRGFRVPNLAMRDLYSFASMIIATRIFYRDKSCTVCKSIYPLTLHHIKGKFDLSDENLTTLCKRCHLTVRHASQLFPK